MSLNEVLERGQRVRLLSGEKGIIIWKNENFEFPLWEIKLENGKILIEARYRFDVLTEPEVSNDPGNSDSPPTVPEELMHLFQSEIYESDDSDMPIVSVLPDLPLLRQTLHKHKNPKKHKEIASCILDSHEDRIQSSQTLVTIDTNQRNIHQNNKDIRDLSGWTRSNRTCRGELYLWGPDIWGNI